MERVVLHIRRVIADLLSELAEAELVEWPYGIGFSVPSLVEGFWDPDRFCSVT